jgi:uncharacterized protein
VLLAFGLKNFFSFKEGVDISFRLGANVPKSISQGKDFAPVLCFKGANGAGKTHLIRGVSFLTDFCTKSFSWDPEANILVENYYRNGMDSEFYVEFYHDKAEYRYELTVNRTHVVREVIYRTLKKKTRLIERVGNEIVYATKPLEELKKLRLRKNVSIISLANQYQSPGLESVYKFFSLIATNVNWAGLRDQWVTIENAAALMKEQPTFLKFAADFIRKCDIGISNILIHEIEDKEGDKTPFPIFVHKVGGKDEAVIDEFESSGTKALFRFLGIYKLMLDTGGVLALDEFDINLHPHILPKLVNLFLDPKINKNDAQLLFTTHDGKILDLLGKYRTYLVAKEDNESFAYRLDEVGGDIIRNDRPLFPVYDEGKIGGVPRL